MMLLREMLSYTAFHELFILFWVQTSSIFFFHDFKQNAVAAAAAAPYQGQYAGYEAYPYSSAAAAAAAGK